MGKNFNHHHVWFNRCEYKEPIAHQFREFEGFVVPMLKVVHKELHDDVLPPPKPSEEQMIGCLGFIALNTQETTPDPLWAVERAIQYFTFEEETGVRDNLVQQMEYLSRGFYVDRRRR